MKITKMVRLLTILTHLTGWKYEQDFLCEISRLKLCCGCVFTDKNKCSAPV
ncbi:MULTISPECIES: hypothetical protein [Pseudomonas]|uniref:hypothetical protein n=1 Tax=Pseudomonas TaxID=286 RepID=UPI0015B5FBD1|nr:MULTISPECIES: hypothetical protein [Pseudomonas]MBJ7372878.1 hypothetical protein [Pseudomonas sp.]MCI9873797.1 hypothetical protein [Pseudomonas atacamensis]